MRFFPLILLFCACFAMIEARQDYSACNLGSREMCTVIPSHFCCRKNRFRRIVRNKGLKNRGRSYYIRLV